MDKSIPFPQLIPTPNLDMWERPCQTTQSQLSWPGPEESPPLLTLKMGQNNKFIIYKPLNFVVVCYAIKLTDTNFTEGLILESLILVVDCFLVCFVILQIIFMKFYLWNPLSLGWGYIRCSRLPQSHFLCWFLDLGFPRLVKYNFKLQTLVN